MSDAFLYTDLDATDQAALVRSGQVEPRELLEAAKKRLELVNSSVNAVAAVDFDLAEEQAQRCDRSGVFAGVPTLVKDLTCVPGLPCGYGSRLFQGFVAQTSSPYIDALKGSGLVVFGKSTTSEFGLMGTTESLASGATRNPWDLSRTTGGSSGGAVAAVAAGIVAVAHASDGGGSIRGPSSHTGLFGFKPSRGRTVQADVPPETPMWSILSEHCISRSVRDSAAWLRVTEADGNKLQTDETLRADCPKLRIGVHTRDCFGQYPEKDVLEVFEQACAFCASLGHEIAPVEMPLLPDGVGVEAVLDLMAASVFGILEKVRQVTGVKPPVEALEPYTLMLAERGEALGADEMTAARKTMTELGALAAQPLEDVDVLLSPTVPFAAFPLGTYAPDAPLERLKHLFRRSAAYTAPASLGGCPAMSVPLFEGRSGLPMGSHFVARKDQDALLFQLAFQLEKARPWAPRLQSLFRKLG
ncbi:amidase [Labrenzia sp. MBR-25]